MKYSDKNSVIVSVELHKRERSRFNEFQYEYDREFVYGVCTQCGWWKCFWL